LFSPGIPPRRDEIEALGELFSAPSSGWNTVIAVKNGCLVKLIKPKVVVPIIQNRSSMIQRRRKTST
ncbi:MAG: hypothetical protein AAFR59_06040, partial [Bacteroidota bacterium]